MISGSIFVPYLGYAVSYFILVDPPLQGSSRYSEIKGMIEALSYRNHNAVSIFPHPPSHESYKTSLLDFLKAATCKDELLTLAHSSAAVIIAVRWEMKVPTDEEAEDSERTVIPLMERPMEVVCISIERLLDTKSTTSFEAYELLNTLYALQYSSEKEKFFGRIRAPEAEKLNDFIMLKPSFFGVGVDLNALFQRFFSRPKATKDVEVHVHTESEV